MRAQPYCHGSCRAAGAIRAALKTCFRSVRSKHRRHRNGLTAHQAMGRVIAGRNLLPGFALPFSSPDQHDHSDMTALRETCRRQKTALDAIGDPSRHPLRGIRRAGWSRAWQNQLVDVSKTFRVAVAAPTAQADVEWRPAAALTGDPGGTPLCCVNQFHRRNPNQSAELAAGTGPSFRTPQSHTRTPTRRATSLIGIIRRYLGGSIGGNTG